MSLRHAIPYLVYREHPLLPLDALQLEPELPRERERTHVARVRLVLHAPQPEAAPGELQAVLEEERDGGVREPSALERGQAEEH